MKRKIHPALLTALLAGAALSAHAQDYRDGDPQGGRDAYQQGYRAGYADGRNGREYDDRIGDRGGDRDDAWRRRYDRHYTYQDDVYYRECRAKPDPAGVIAGAIIGGLLGNGVSRGSGAATAVGVIVGGAAGAALTSDTRDCGDRSYIYRTYYTAFNGGREGRLYEWRNPGTNNWGGVRTDRFYNDPDGFRCVDFSQSFRINGGKYERRGSACQDHGTWTVIR